MVEESKELIPVPQLQNSGSFEIGQLLATELAPRLLEAERGQEQGYIVP
jgi:hypothetical protein